MIAVVVVLAILALLGVALFSGESDKARNTVAQLSVVSTLKVAATVYADGNQLPAQAALVSKMNSENGGFQFVSYTGSNASTNVDVITVNRESPSMVSVCSLSGTGNVYCANESFVSGLSAARLAPEPAPTAAAPDSDPGFFAAAFQASAYADATAVKFINNINRSACVGVVETDTRSCLSTAVLAARSVGRSLPNWEDGPAGPIVPPPAGPPPGPPPPTYASYNTEVGNDNPTATCPFDESGSAYVNLVCTGIGGQLQDQSPRFSTQQAGAILTNPANRAVYFNGATHYSYGNPASQSTGNGVSQWSSEIWVKPQTAPQTATVISGDDNWSMDIVGASGFRCVTRVSVGWTTDTVVGGPAAVAGQWYHLVCTYNNGVFKLYVNGVERATKSAVGGGQSGTGNIRPGAAGGWWNGTAWLNGTVDQFSFYRNTTLSPARVTAHYGSAGY